MGALLADLDVLRVAYSFLHGLSRRTGETAALMVWDGGEAVCVEQVPSTHQVKHTTPWARGTAQPQVHRSRSSAPGSTLPWSGRI